MLKITVQGETDKFEYFEPLFVFEQRACST